ncbi:hypothetical protein MMC21_007631 [Puttea exsequens]|nr:hypothetical protein [Puttea exsequens]
MPPQKTILITGCSTGGLGEALALSAHAHGLKVIATARTVSKMAPLAARGITTLPLDVQYASSISQCVSTVSTQTSSTLDILLNNAGSGYSMPLTDSSLAASRQLFDLNVLSLLAVTKAFLPLLRSAATPSSPALLVNNTSVASVTNVPHQGIYNASKAAAASLTEQLRIELAPFDIAVTELKTGAVQSEFFRNLNGGETPKLPPESIYGIAREEVERCMAGEELLKIAITREAWAEGVVEDLVAKGKARKQIWRGGRVWLVWFATSVLPVGWMDGLHARMGALDVVERKMREGEGKGA